VQFESLEGCRHCAARGSRPTRYPRSSVTSSQRAATALGPSPGSDAGSCFIGHPRDLEDAFASVVRHWSELTDCMLLKIGGGLRLACGLIARARR